MYRGTTPTFRLTFSVEISDIKKAYISFYQNKIKVVEKTLSDCEVESERVARLTLSQKETLRFDEGKALCQVRYITNDDKVEATNIEYVIVNGVLKEGEIE